MSSVNECLKKLLLLLNYSIFKLYKTMRDDIISPISPYYGNELLQTVT